MEKFRLRAIGPTCGDETTPYEVIFNESMTVREFSDYVLTLNEWGCIGIYNPDARSFFGDPQRWYHQDKWDSGPLPENIMDKTIKKAYASGGWSRMNYMLTL